jgi:hypothetical protein
MTMGYIRSGIVSCAMTIIMESGLISKMVPFTEYIFSGELQLKQIMRPRNKMIFSMAKFR